MRANKLALAIHLAVCGAAVAQPQFTERSVATNANTARSVFAVDVDGDGDTDLLSASSADDKIAWYENDGTANPTFTLRTVATDANAARSVFAADVDGDGDTDLLSASSVDNKIAWYENDGMANPGFTLHTVDIEADSATSVFAADLDGDGDTDLVSASRNDDKIAWYENDGMANPGFTLHTVATNAERAYSVFVADVDGDGDTDLLSASYLDDKIAWYENDGMANPSFTLHTVATNADGAFSVFAADVDGDGDTDLVSASYLDDKVAWYENDGSQNFTLHTVATNADSAVSVFAADVDGDGDTDLLSASRVDDKVAWYENDGSQNFALHTVTTNADGAYSVFATDVDGDGDTDLVSASRNDDKIAWYQNDGRQSFSAFDPASTIATNADGAYSLFAADVDGDGDIDVVSASFYDDKIAWYENDGMVNPAFTLHTVATNADSAVSVFAADLDGDGDTDLLSASSNDDKIAWYENDGSQNFTLHTLATNANGASSVFAADVDGDGDIDLLSGFRPPVPAGADDIIAWYENDGAANPGFTLHTVDASAFIVKSVFAADVDGDGDTDVLSASAFDDKIAWYENDGMANPGFTLHTVADNADFARSVFASDVDGDGDTDLVSASTNDNKIAWYENDGNQAFTLHTVATNAAGVRSVSAADLDGDGDTDLLSASRYDNKIAWYENDGSQNFTLRTVTTNAFAASAAIAADLDGDGDTDLVSTSFGNDSVDWYENRTIHRSAAFASANVVATNADSARSVFAVDVDGDGDTDLLSASRYDNKIAWYENDGSQNFTLHTVATNASGALSVFAADLDGDGDTDLVSASRFDDKIAWYENDGMVNPAFTLYTVATNADWPYSVFAADVDGDGDIDLLSASLYDDKVAWYENDGMAPPGFTLHTVATNADGAFSVFAADLDGDGDTDMVSASYNDSKIAWYENDGSQNFTLHTVETNANGPRSVFAADVDGDGDMDLSSATFYGRRIAWYENDGQTDPVFTLQTVATNADLANSVFAADLDGDGDTDLVSASYNDNKIAWYENDGSQAFELRTVATDASQAFSVFAADVDGDGDIDLVSASSGDDKIAWYENCGGQFLIGGSGSAPALAVQGQPVQLLTLDYLHNGRIGDSVAVLDSIALRFADVSGRPLNTAQANDLIDQVTVYLDDGDLAFDPGVDTLVGSLDQLLLTPVALSHAVQTLALDQNGGVSVAATGSARLFVEALLTVDAASQIPNQLQVTAQQTPLPRPQSSDAISASVLSLECAMNAASGVLGAVPPTPVNLSVSAGSGAEVTADAITVTATADSAVTGDQTIDLASGSSATLNSDYTLGDTRITIPDGMTQGSVIFTVIDDAVLEGAETATLTLQNPSPGLVLGTTLSQDIDITDNDAASVAIGDVIVAEDGVTATFTATLTGAVQGGFTVDFATADGTAIGGEDYTTNAGTLSFNGNDGETQTIQVAITDDAVLEGDESFDVTLSLPTQGVTLGQATGSGTITDNDAASVAIGDVIVAEDGTTATFTGTLTGAVQGGFTVDFATADGTAIAGEDFTANAGTLVFAGNDGETQTIQVAITDDAVLEGDESFDVTLSLPTQGVTLGQATGSGTITDNDAASVAIDNVTLAEDGVTATFTATLTGAVQGGFTVDFATADGTAIAGEDYTANAGTLVFAGNDGETQTIQVAITDDAVLEGDESFDVTLSLPTQGVTISQATGSGTITDNEPRPDPLFADGFEGSD